MSRLLTHRLAPLIVLILGGIAIGFAPIFVRLAEVGPAAAAFWRMALAAPILVIMIRPAAADWQMANTAGLKFAALAGLVFACDLSFWHWSIKLTSVANATALANLAPVVVTALAWLLFREKPSRAFLLALVMAVSGGLIMAAANPHGEGRLLGDILGVTTCLWYGSYFIAMKAARSRVPTSLAMLVSTLVCAAVLLPIALILREPLLPASLNGWLACLGLALIVHVGGQGAISWSLGHLPTALTALVVLIQPVVAGALAWVLFGEALTALQIAGGALALGGVVIAQMKK